MHKTFIILTLTLAACGNSAELAQSVPVAATGLEHPSSIPPGFSIIEQSPNGFFIRLASAERPSVGTIRELADALSHSYERIDLCIAGAHERGDEYLAIIDGKVFDYENNRIYPLNAISE